MERRLLITGLIGGVVLVAAVGAVSYRYYERNETAKPATSASDRQYTKLREEFGGVHFAHGGGIAGNQSPDVDISSSMAAKVELSDGRVGRATLDQQTVQRVLDAASTIAARPPSSDEPIPDEFTTDVRVTWRGTTIVVHTTAGSEPTSPAVGDLLAVEADIVNSSVVDRAPSRAMERALPGIYTAVP